MAIPVIICHLGLQDYNKIWHAMQDFVAKRSFETVNEIWVVEHPAVFTQGQAGNDKHIINHLHNIPVIHTDRGGQITYHAPGQLIFYLLLDIKNYKSGIKHLITKLQLSIIDYLQTIMVHAYTQHDAPGVYTNAGKIAFLGLKIKKGGTYHGISFNFDIDLTPFSYINPCGYKKLAITNLHAIKPNIDKAQCITDICKFLCYNLLLEQVD